jgi:HPt (histidine-containing phosphotransfer) domain-containing protein
VDADPSPHLHGMIPEQPNAADGLELIDNSVLEDLRALGGCEDPGLLQELIDLFLGDAPRRIDEMHLGLREGDFSLMQRSAHTLKSSSANLGATRLSQVCKDLEFAARDQDRAGYEALINGCLAVYIESERMLREIAARDSE